MWGYASARPRLGHHPGGGIFACCAVSSRGHPSKINELHSQCPQSGLFNIMGIIRTTTNNALIINDLRVASFFDLHNLRETAHKISVML